jgi:hypothetical protein
MADNVVRNGRPQDHVEVLGRIGVAPRDADSGGKSVVIHIGASATQVQVAIAVNTDRPEANTPIETFAPTYPVDNTGKLLSE